MRCKKYITGYRKDGRMKKAKKIAIIGVISLTLLGGSLAAVKAATIHTAVPGDTYWKLSQKYNVGLDDLLEANGAGENSILYVGQRVIIPDGFVVYEVKRGDTLWIISQRFNADLERLMQLNGLTENSYIYPGQKLKLPPGVNTYTVQPGDTFWIISNRLGVDLEELMEANSATSSTLIYPGQVLLVPSGSNSKANEGKPWVTYITHTVQPGEDFWQLGIKYGIPSREILEANGLNEDAVIYPGQKLRIPVHHIPVKPTPGPQYGELLDWWTEAQYLWPIGKDARIIDFYTGVSWNMRRTIGSYHADAEPLTRRDAEIMKEVWGGSWSWSRRPVIVEVDGRRIAASASAMPHDISYIKDNGFDGHSDIHFFNSLRHKDGEADVKHQQNVHIAAGK